MLSTLIFPFVELAPRKRAADSTETRLPGVPAGG
jgi:hypothetical protein